ncbi:hypothetical protein [Microvirga flavescens]|uniref:hypothetical protein n=1 Tax=Microvirga flavescens TaxID=2249811 RepID=UPI000DD8E1A2|nr:hypothetical protein [Microvirga flavescens]
MQRALLASLIALSVSACGSYPSIEEQIQIVDSPADVRVCKNLGEVSPVVPTGPDFDEALWQMKHNTIGLGGTHVYVQQVSQDWSAVRGIAYYCSPGPAADQRLVRAKG